MTLTRDSVGMSPVDDAARVQALDALHLLDTPPEDRFDRIAQIAQKLFGVGTAGVNLVDRDRQFTKSGLGRLLSGDEMPREDSLCTFTVQQDETLEITDALADPFWASHPAVVGDLAVRFYAGVPLRAPGGERVGALCLLDTSPRTLSSDERELLAGLAELVERELASTAEMEQGREVQRRLLPRRSPDLPGWEIAGTSIQRGAVGGDFYDWQVLDGSVQLLLCDVMGKGLSAALLASAVRVVARGASPHHDLSATVGRISEDLHVDLEETESFVTAFVGRIDPSTGTLQYVDAGHGLAFVLEPGGAHRRLASVGLPLGTLAGESWSTTLDTISPGECLVVVSDGLLDLHDDPDALARAIHHVADGSLPASEVARAIATSGAGRATDDVTVLVARRSEA